MKITQRLTADHKMFRKLAEDLDRWSDAPPLEWVPLRINKVVGLFQRQLRFHAACEDRFYYPAVRKFLSSTVNSPLSPVYMDHLDEEHKTIDVYMSRLLKETIPENFSRTWPQSFALFYQGLRVHMKREEEELFPVSEKILGEERLESLAEEIEREMQIRDVP